MSPPLLILRFVQKKKTFHRPRRFKRRATAVLISIDWIKFDKFRTKHSSGTTRFQTTCFCHTKLSSLIIKKKCVKKNSYFAFDNSYCIRHPKSSRKVQSSQLGTSRDSSRGRGRGRGRLRVRDFLVHAREQPASFWRGNVIAVVIQQRDLVNMS